MYDADNIVLGGNLSALLYAYVHNYPCIFIRPIHPFRFDEMESEIGKNKRQLWEQLMVSLSVAGLCPLSDKASNMSVSDNTLKVVSSTSRMVKYNFKKLHVFDDYKISGLPLRYPQETPTLRVFDWFNVRSGMEHEHDKLISEDDFVKEVIFYPSVRFGNQESGRIRKDLVAISHIHADDLEDFEVSDTMARFKIIDMMKEVGIRGAPNDRDWETNRTEG